MTAAFRHIALGGVGSTNDEARARLAQLAEGPFVVTGAEQSTGRGRRGRVWRSPRGNLYASFAFQPGAPLARLPELSFVAALAVCDMARELAAPGVAIRCKWPNDVLAGDAKLSGILLETAGWPDGARAVIAGIGVNIAAAPPDTPYPATSLSALGYRGGAESALQSLSRAFSERLAAWTGEGFAPIRRAWLAAADGLGEPIIARLPDRSLRGVFAGLDKDGALMLETGKGDMLRIAAADVFRVGSGEQGERYASRD